MEVSFDAMLKDNARLFQQIVDDRSRMKNSGDIEVYLYEFPEPGRVVVFESLSISKRL